MTNKNVLRDIISAALLTVIMLSSVSIFILAPSYKKLIITITENEAVKVANHLEEMLILDSSRESISLVSDFEDILGKSIKDFNLAKIKVFTADGTTIYSTAGKDIGNVNKHDYFHQNVARGEVYTKVVKKDGLSLEGQKVTVDLVETYVPIMADGKFQGSFEIYLEITDVIKLLTDLLNWSNGLMLAIAVGLLSALLIIARKAAHSFRARDKAELQLIQQNNELAVINDVSTTLSSSVDLDDLLPKVLETVVDRLAILRLYRKGGILLRNGEHLELATHLGHPEAFLTLHENLTINDCLCGLAARTGEVIYSANSHEDKHHTICYHGMDPHGHIIIPLLSGTKVVGVLYLYLPANTEVDKTNRDLLRSIGNQIGLAVDNARLFAETRRLSLHDPLTGLANRRNMEEALSRTISAAQRYMHPLSVAMLDIDYFKKYNDTHGHSEGDELLTRVAKKISDLTRTTDHPARYGGEEFLIILTETAIDGAIIACERIRIAIAELGVTISIGLAQHHPGMEGDELIKAADKALYLAKENGRDRIECAEVRSES